MNSLAKDLLEQSIVKYKNYIDKFQEIKGSTITQQYFDENFPIGKRYCALCHEFNNHRILILNELSLCFGCPVYEKTKTQFCENTPFDKIFNMCDILDDLVIDDNLINSFTDELNFLISLRDN